MSSMNPFRAASGDRELLFRSRIPGCGLVQVERRIFRGEPVRVLAVNGAVQSAVFENPRRRGSLLFRYMKGFDWIPLLLPESRNTFLIGGGGFVYPMHYCAARPGCRMEAAELFPEMTELARRFFYFDEREYPNLTVRTGDGLRVLRESSALYDAIINDAFTGHAPSGALTGEEAIRVIRSRLAPGGIYCVNLATALRGPFYLRTGRMLRILRKYFRYTLLLPMYENRNAYEPQNCLLFASEREFRWFSLDLGEN